MLKKDYLEILYRIECKTENYNVFDYDKVLDGTYNFNVNEVSIVYDLLSIIEKLALANNSLICYKQNEVTTKELKFRFNDVLYMIKRSVGTDENTVICRISVKEDSSFVTEDDLLFHINEKCLANNKLLASIFNTGSSVQT